MELYYMISIALATIILILVILIIILFLKYKKLRSKIYGKIELPESEEGIDDRYFEERIESIKKKTNIN